MEAILTPRQMAKALLNGELPSRPLFLPIAFSLGAKVENVPLASFLSAPAKIVSSSRQMRGHLRADAAVCYFDPYLEVEALGANLQRASEDAPPVIRWSQPRPGRRLPEGLRSPEESVLSGRAPVAAEVIRRMNALPNRDFLLLAGVTGPMTLASRIAQPGQEEALRSAEIPPDESDLPTGAIELAAAVVTDMATAFLEAGADLILIQEDRLPASPKHFDAWANLLDPAINVARFYEALPVLQLSDAPAVLENRELLSRHHWECVLCVPIDAIASPQWAGCFAVKEALLGISLPLSAFQSDAASAELSLTGAVSALRPAVITTAGDIPVSTDMKRLTQVLGNVPRAY